jgi:ATP-binding cassette subfamily B protein
VSAPEDELSGPPARLFDGALIRRLLGYTRPHRLLLVGSVLATLLLTGSTIAIPSVIQRAVDHYLAAADLPVEARQAGLGRLSLLLIAMSLATFVFRSALLYMMSWIGQQVAGALRNAVFAKILGLPLQYFDRNPVGRLMTRITSDLDALQQFVQRGLVGLVSNAFLLVGVMAYALAVNFRLALTLFTVLPVLGLLLGYINWKTRVAHRQARSRMSALNALLQECLSGVRTIQLFNRGPAKVSAFAEINGGVRRAQVTAATWTSAYFPAIEVVRAAANVLLLGVGGWMLGAGVTLGELIAFFFFVRYFFRPLEELSEQSLLLQGAMVSAERVFTLLDEPEILHDPVTPAEFGTFRGEVVFRNVTFAYAGGPPVLRNLDLRIPAGSSAALVGATGSGKTSIISLIARYYDVQEGAVEVDGRDVRAYRQIDLRRRIGIVQQEPVIFSTTLLENIRLRNPAVTRAQVEAAARYVNAHAFIERLPQGYETVAGERGSNLSSGQKQLIALARAFVQNPDILLVLDEATASVDSETEELIQGALARLMRDRTTLFIAHRLSTILHVDQIVVLRRGEIVERGPHAELLARDGYYRTLFELMSHAPEGARSPS